MIERKNAIFLIKQRLNTIPVVGLLGPRQCGKTTLAKQIPFQHYFDLERPEDLAKFDQPQLFLEKLKGTIIIDEVQRKPELFPLLRHLVDTHTQQKYLILGSASRELIRQSSETLAGRISYFYLTGFTLEEVGEQNQNCLWLRGGYPRSFLATSEGESLQWRKDFITTFLERDIPQLGIAIPAETLRRFWIMLSHYHGQTLNYSELSRSFGVSDMTIRHYIDILVGTFMVRLLQPWHANVGKRIVKSPKIYLKDSGIFHALQTISSDADLFGHPKLGASWEGFALEQLATQLQLTNEELFFFATHGGMELDLFWQQHGKNWGAEFKYTEAPSVTKSMRVAIKDLKLEHLWVIYPGQTSFPIDKKITVLPVTHISTIFPF